MQQATEESVLDHVGLFFNRLGIPHVMLRQVTVEDRRLDGLLVADTFVMAIEAKTNRADYRRETDAKRQWAWAVANLCMYAAPAGVIDPNTLPDGWGLIEVPDGQGTPALVISGIRHTPLRPLSVMERLLIQRTARVEDSIRRPETPATERAALQHQIETLTETVSRREQALARERARAQHAAEQVLIAVGEQECADCRAAITYHRIGGWTHVDHDRDEPCRRRRQEAERLRREQAYGVAYIASYTPPVVPAALVADDSPPSAATGR